MARGTQLLQLVSMVRNEVGRADNVAVGVDDIYGLKQVINRVYETLYAGYDWPHLKKQRETISLSAGSYHYNVPSAVDYTRLEGAWVKYNGLYHPIDRGITVEDYGTYDTYADSRSDPVLKWDIVLPSSTEMVEVWPIPASNGQTLVFTGYRKFTRLVNDSDTCLIDDNLVAAFAAAEILTGESAKAKLGHAQSLYNILRSRAKGGAATHTFNQMPASSRPTQAIVRVS